MEILALLTQGPRDVTTVAKRLKYSTSTVSKRLNDLWNGGFVEFSREKQRRIYRLRPGVNVEVKNGMLSVRASAMNDDSFQAQLRLSDDFLQRNGQFP
jgi:DNA-binding IclR family transcriptional regulator